MALSNIFTLKTLRSWPRWTFSKANIKSREKDKKDKMLKKCKRNLRSYLRKNYKKGKCYLRLHHFSFKLTWITSSNLSTTVKNDAVFLLLLQTLLFYFQLIQSCLFFPTNVYQEWIWWVVIHKTIFELCKNMRRKDIQGEYINLY